MRDVLLLLLCAAATLAQARIREEQVDLPVRVVDGFGKTIEHPIKVTVWSDDANPQPAPVLVLNHGRAPGAPERAALGRARYGDASRWFVQRGFIVAVPTRMGYGVSGGPDAEDTGSCSNKVFAPGYAVAAQQTLAVLAMVRERPDAAGDRAVVVGQSFGGATSAAVAAQNPAGVQAAINFAGGGGGNPKTQPGNPCAPHRMEALYRDYGRTAAMPMLWIYTENDLYFGPRVPREWHQAYTASGAKAEFVQFPPHGEDGHSLFTRFPAVWQPKVGEFLDAVGFPAPASKAP
ncbi:MAG TPA: dienelactone hydrolase family protein [Ramlibacter sp.]|nr:dienelactone hydrolase family protein [Ramlibacter sp.]HZY18780.1 dienelactone hydrolase family protein [Ramlibacter sp.]